MNLTQNKFLTEDEIKNLNLNLKHTKNKVHVLAILFLKNTGARQSEALGVRKKDLHSNGHVTIFGLKGSNNRTVPLPPAFFQELKNHAKNLNDDDFIFNFADRTFRHIWSLVTPNKNKSLHCLRHTFGVKLYNNCGDILTVKTFLGHSNIKNTMVYLEFVESNKKLKQSINNMWGNKLKVA